MYQVIKRDGKITEFDLKKITRAIEKAFISLKKEYHPSVIDMLALKVTSDFEKKIKDHKIAVEDIQAYEEGLYTFLDSDAQGVAAMEDIRTTGKLEGETEEKLKAALADYTDRFLKTR